MGRGARTIIPAGGRLVPTHAYDTIVASTMRERRWRPQIANDIACRFGDAPAIVDVGAGTGSIACVLRELRTVFGSFEVLRGDTVASGK
jgi:precorrin-6B methylase 2